MTGPHTVGSIDARITADASDFHREAAAVRREAAELGALSPSVDVNANVGPALARMGEVEAMSRQLETQNVRLATAERLLSTESGRLNDTNVRLAATERGLSREQEHSASIASRLADTEARLAAARTHSTAVTETDTAAVGRNVDSNNRRISGLQVLLALAPAIVAAAAPVGAAAVGLGGAFGVMATAGVFAFKGIQREMELGTVLGAKYSDGLEIMSGYMDALKHTTAVGMLQSFNQAQDQLRVYMPNINSMLGEFSGTLGQVGNVGLTGVLRGLVQLNPLIQAGGVELGKFVGWLTSFSENNGFSGFVQYATSNLPGVMDMIRGLVTLAGNILAAFAPLGPVVIGFISGFSDALNGLPLPVLAGLVTSALLLGPALRVAFSSAVAAQIAVVAAKLTLTGIAAQLAVPVVGVLTAVIAGIAVASTAAALSTGQATVAVEDYTQALKDDNNAIGEHVRLQAAKSLSDSGAFEAAKKMGIAQNDLTSAVLGESGAIAKVNAARDTAQAKIDQLTEAGRGNTRGTNDNKVAIDGLKSGLDLVTSSVDVNALSIEKGKVANENMAAAMQKASDTAGYQVTASQALAAQHGINATAYQAATAAQESAGAQLEATTAKMYLQNDASGILKAALDGLNGEAITAAQAQNAFDSSLVNMGDHVDKTGKQVTFTTTSITDMSSASVALRGQLNSQVTNLQNVIAANGGLYDSTGKAKEEMLKLKQQVIDNAVAHGVDKDAVTQYINTLLKTPATIPPTKLDVDTANALAKTAELKNYIASLQGKTVWITSHINSIYSETHVSNGKGGSGGQTRSEGGAVYRADGGPVYLANGGHSSGPRGSDTVAAWLTPGEHVMRRSSAQSIGAPALNYMNQTGKLPPSGSQAVNVQVFIDGKEMRGEMVQIAVQQASQVLTSAVNDAKNRRS